MRWEKVVDFLVPPKGGGIAVHPRPWDEDGAPYFLVNPIRNEDGCGGYLRNHRLDENGVPYRLTRAGERRYEPLLAARYALKLLAIARVTGEEQAGKRARRVLPWLLASGRVNGAWGPGTDPSGMVGGVPSAMVQGVVISAILRLVGGAPDADTMELLERSLDWMERPLAKGGVRSTLAGRAFLEEVPRIPPGHILNGCIYGLFGLYDLADALGHERARRLAAEVESALERGLHRFTTRSGWSLYALNVGGRPLRASVHYHLSHIFLLRIVADRTGSEMIRGEVARWEHALRCHRVRALEGLRKIIEVVRLRYVQRLPLAEG